MVSEGVEIWVIYDHPIDFPNEFVARKFIDDKPTVDVIVMPTLEEVRMMLPDGLVKMDRSPVDDPKIVETWM